MKTKKESILFLDDGIE